MSSKALRRDSSSPASPVKPRPSIPAAANSLAHLDTASALRDTKATRYPAAPNRLATDILTPRPAPTMAHNGLVRFEFTAPLAFYSYQIMNAIRIPGVETIELEASRP